MSARLRCETADHSRLSSLVSRFISSDGQTEAERNAEKLMDLMTKSSAMQAMMLNALPPAARNPDVVKQLLQDPAMRQKLVKQIASMNLRIPTHILQSMDPNHMDETFQRARKMGIDPQIIFAKLQSHPHLLAKLQEPKIMEAFSRTSADPSAVVHVDPETLATIQEIRKALGYEKIRAPPSTGGEIPLQSAVTPSPADESSSSSPPPPPDPPSQASSASPLTPPPPKSTTAPLPPINLGTSQGAINMSRLISLDPELSQKVTESPKILKAFQAIAKSPWRTILYIFDKEIMDCFTKLNMLMKKGPMSKN